MNKKIGIALLFGLLSAQTNIQLHYDIEREYNTTTLEMFKVDYAYIQPLKISPFESSHIISLGIILNKSSDLIGKITP